MNSMTAACYKFIIITINYYYLPVVVKILKATNIKLKSKVGMAIVIIFWPTSTKPQALNIALSKV